MKTTIFKIEGMNCDACANTIKSLLEKEPGVRMASVSFSERQARVLYDPQSVQEDRAGVIDQLLNEANKQGEKSNVEGMPVKEAAPAK
jgi:copper chaperone